MTILSINKDMDQLELPHIASGNILTDLTQQFYFQVLIQEKQKPMSTKTYTPTFIAPLFVIAQN